MATGFGFGPFGIGPFGEWDWAQSAIVSQIPEIYKAEDQDVGDGSLLALLTVLANTLDDQRILIKNYDQLRDPLLCPTENAFMEFVLILKVVNNGNGTSSVFMSEGVNGDVFDGLRIGQDITDGQGNRFSIAEIHSSGLASEVVSPPIDPVTGNPIGKFIIINNVSAGALEIFPLVSGVSFRDEPVVGGGAPPFSFTLAHAPLAANRVTVIWFGVSTPTVQNVGYFNNDGSISGDLGLSSSIDFTTGNIVLYPRGGDSIVGNSVKVSYTQGFQVVNELPSIGPSPPSVFTPSTHTDDGVQAPPYVFSTLAFPIMPGTLTVSWTQAAVSKSGSFDVNGVPSGNLGPLSTIDFSLGLVTLSNSGGGVIDNQSISVNYTPQDAEITAQHVLAFLGSDYGASLDRHDPDIAQRSYIFNAVQLWNLKGTADGYFFFGEIAGFLVKATYLYRISPFYQSAFLSPPNGDNGVNLPPYIFLTANSPISIGILPGVGSAYFVTLDWTEGGIPKTGHIYVMPGDLSTSHHDGGVGVGSTLDFVNGVVTFFTIGGTPVDNLSLRVSYGSFPNERPFTFRRLPVDDVFRLPSGSNDFYTDIDPKRPVFDDIGADEVPSDVFDFDPATFPFAPTPGYPNLIQDVTILSVTFVRFEGINSRYAVVAEAFFAQMSKSLGVTGNFTDFNGHVFPVENYVRIDSGDYQFEVATLNTPVVGVGTVEWKAPNWPLTVTTETSFGPQYAGFDGLRLRLHLTIPSGNPGPTWNDPMSTPVIGALGDWCFIDPRGNVSRIETVIGSGTSGGTDFIDIEVVAPELPWSPFVFNPQKGCYLFYAASIQVECDFCRASLIRVLITPLATITPEELAEDALGRLITRLAQMVPVHVRIAAFVYDPGLVTAFIAINIAVTGHTIEESSSESEYLTGVYDQFDPGDGPNSDDLVADSQPTDEPFTIESVTISTPTNLYIFEENVDGNNPLSTGWSGTGLWCTSENLTAGELDDIAFSRPQKFHTGLMRFLYGRPLLSGNSSVINDVTPNTGSLVSPLIGPVAAAATVSLIFNHYFNNGGGAVNYLATIDILDSVGGVLGSFTKNQVDPNMVTFGFSLRTGGGGAPAGDWDQRSLDIKAMVLGAGQFRVRFTFDTVAAGAPGSYEGWYIDNVIVKVT